MECGGKRRATPHSIFTFPAFNWTDATPLCPHHLRSGIRIVLQAVALALAGTSSKIQRHVCQEQLAPADPWLPTIQFQPPRRWNLHALWQLSYFRRAELAYRRTYSFPDASWSRTETSDDLSTVERPVISPALALTRFSLASIHQKFPQSPNDLGIRQVRRWFYQITTGS
jgi:hypothetical protein